MTAPVMFSFLAGHGVTAQQFALLKMGFNLVGFMFEIPLGIVSDMMGRKIALVLSGVLNAGSALVYVIGLWSLEWLLVAETCRAIGMSFISGTDEALAYERDPTGYDNFWPKAVWYTALAEATFWGTGYLGKSWGVSWIFQLVLALHCLQIVVSAFLPETYHHDFESWRDEWGKLRKLTADCFGSAGALRQLMIQGSLVTGVGKIANFLIEPVAGAVVATSERIISLSVMTVLFGSIFGLGKKIARPRYLLVFGFVIAGLSISMGLIGKGLIAALVVVALLALLQLSISAVSVGLQPLTDPHFRATISSYRGGLDRVVSTAAWGIIGGIGIEAGSITIGGIMALLLFFVWKKA